MTDVETRLQAIEDRNSRVEADKAWEVSFTRRGFIMFMIYLTATLFLWLIGIEFPFLHAIVPAAGYVFSTLSLPSVKAWWIRKVHSKRILRK